MSIRMWKAVGGTWAVAMAAVMISVGGCSSKSATQPPDPGLDAGIDASDAGIDAIDAAVADCEQAQRAYVSGLLVAGQQPDIATTVDAVLRTADFHQAMPYCSGDRPAELSAGGSTRSSDLPTR